MKEIEKIKKSNELVEVQGFESQILDILKQNQLPHENVFVGIPQRMVVFKNLNHVISLINIDNRQNSIYISKFIAAVASGLFDAAINYLWNQTIIELRNRVVQYDLSYFYDQAVGTDTDKRRRLNDENDLVKLDDSMLIYGAKEIELISEIGYKHLDHIRYMRNWISAAHPNQNELTGLKIISWLETCINEVISLPISNIAMEIKKLLTNIKTTRIDNTEAKQIASFFTNLTNDQINTLASGLFGLYVRRETNQTTRENIESLIPFLKNIIDSDTKKNFGIKYGKYVANSDEEQKTLAENFLKICDCFEYMPEDLKAAKIDNAIINLVNVHNNANNFYNEPAFADSLKKIIGQGKVPNKINKKYVIFLIYIAISNGNGVSWDADVIYTDLINNFDSNQALMGVLSFKSNDIASKLQFKLCKKKYIQILNILKNKFPNDSIAIDLINKIINFPGSFDNIIKDSEIKRISDNLISFLK